ncbi:hypothetical protein OIT41_13770 [Arthrobacter sp. YA7-1]|uniref:hypothetical protein n=1 Tax=Arthrobacter sp. YA7-1 TaxID=2987701 RepID=UPI00222693DA|nr:hypothetical protein [Arthrobacter sp. YA7-1]UYY80390.1 hypothetical protein OIT41_13770 [Arthrobacter sp. YA7-1]
MNGPQSPLHRARKQLSFARTILKQHEDKHIGDVIRRRAHIATLELLIARLEADQR